MAPSVKLTYFNGRGRSEPARLLLAYGGIEYEDCRLPLAFEDPSEWKVLKPQTPYGSLPLLEWDGCQIAQATTITRFIARKVRMAGRSRMEAAQIDEVVDAVNDLFEVMVKAVFSNDEAAMKKAIKETIPNGLGNLETRLCSRGGQYFAGNVLSWADIHTYNFCSGLPNQSCLDKCPKIQNLVTRVGEIPNIKCWVEKRPVTKL